MFFKEAIQQNLLELLRNLQQEDLLKDFYLAGETSLAIQIGHRKSIDLDLLTMNDFDTNELLEFLEENYKFQLTYSSKNTLKGFINNIKVDFITHKYKFVKNPLFINSQIQAKFIN